jgi:hypothetical protein
MSVIGVTYENVVMADLDDMSFRRVKRLAFKAVKRFNLGGFIILKSSRGNYHVVFNEPKDRFEVFQIIGWIGITANNPNVWKWVCMQAVKGALTLRLSPKPLSDGGFKPPPKVVYRYGEQDKCIKDFLKIRRNVLNAFKCRKIQSKT